MKIVLPDCFQRLFDPIRFKVLSGGRGSAKSESVARALLIMGSEKFERILCTREYQSNIQESVHKTLSDIINQYKLDYNVLKYSIEHRKTGAEFIFEGLQNMQGIKSIKGITKCWCEEAQTTKQDSLDILIPTIREENSELIFTLNKLFKEDPVIKTLKDRPNTWYHHSTYRDNPWFPEVLRKEMEHDRVHNYPKYLHVWEGEPLESNPYALWKVDDIKYRIEIPQLRRIVIGVDPAVSVSKDSDETGIIVVGKGIDGHNYVIEDLSGKYTPSEWARVVENAYIRWHADKVIAEKNQGGDLVENNLKTINSTMAVKLVHATKGKFVRAEPIASLYQENKVFHAKKFLELEKQMFLFNNMVDRKNDFSPDRCLIGSTKITTKNGYKNIKDITTSDYVLTRCGYKKILVHEQTNKEAAVYEVQLSNEHKIIGTSNHPIFTHQGVKTIDKLVCGDMLISEDLYIWKLKLLSLMGLNIKESQTQKTNINQDISGVTEMESLLHYTEIFMKNIMAQSLRGLWFIIKMVISLITIFIILNLLIIKNMLNIIKERWTINKENTSHQLEIKQENGIRAKKDMIGMLNMLKRFLIILKKLAKYVYNVISNLVQQLDMLSSVQKNVEIKTKEILTNMKYKLSVLFVKIIFGIVNILVKEHKKHVHVLAVRKCLKKQPVYNILVSDKNEYFANGVLVHNCDALVWGLTEIGLNKDYGAEYRKILYG